MLNFDPNLRILILSGEKLQKYCEKNDSLEYLSKMFYMCNALFEPNVLCCKPKIYTKTYWPAGGGRGQNPENTAQGHSGQNAIRP